MHAFSQTITYYDVSVAIKGATRPSVKPNKMHTVSQTITHYDISVAVKGAARPSVKPNTMHAGSSFFLVFYFPPFV